VSVRVLHACFEGAKGVTGNDRAVLLVLADHASDDGSGAYPSHATIARKAGGIGERTVRDCLRRLQEGNWIDREGWSPKHTISYRVEIDPAAVAGFKLGSNPAAARQVREVEPGENASATRQPSADEPSIEPSVHTDTSSPSLLSLLELVREAVGQRRGVPPLNEERAVRYAEEAAKRGVDVFASAEKFGFYYREGRGERVPIRDLTARWREWLNRETPQGAQQRQRAFNRQGRRAGMSFAELDALGDQFRAEEAA
jgi:hypothetical protein